MAVQCCLADRAPAGACTAPPAPYGIAPGTSSLPALNLTLSQQSRTECLCTSGSQQYAPPHHENVLHGRLPNGPARSSRVAAMCLGGQRKLLAAPASYLTHAATTVLQEDASAPCVWWSGSDRAGRAMQHWRQLVPPCSPTYSLLHLFTHPPTVACGDIVPARLGVHASRPRPPRPHIATTN